MNTAFCRAFQAGLKVGNYFMGYRTPQTIEGAGCLCDLPKKMKEMGIGDVLVVTGRVLTKMGAPDPLYRALEAEGISYAIFNDISANPSSDDVEAGYKIYREHHCRALIALGGGTPMDCAKAIAARAVCPNKSVAQLQGLLKVGKKVPPFFAVPTTAGSGSETTVAAVITDSVTHRKAAINDPHIIPQFAVLDPTLTMALPPFTTATTGMDALCHAVEAYTNHTYNTKLEDELAIQAVQLIHDNLFTAYENGGDLTARANMQKASFCAGRAFTRGCVGYVHAVGHTLGGLYGVAHGLAMAVILPHVLRQYGTAVYPRLAELAAACGMDGATEAERAVHFIEWIEQLNARMAIPTGFDMIREQDIPQMIEWATKEANPLYPVPVVWDEADFRRLIDKLRLPRAEEK